MKTTVLPLLLGASLLRADLIPDSPLLRLGSELDLHFTAKARAEYTDNIFLSSVDVANLPDSGLSLELTPGLEFNYGKDLPLTAKLSLGRTYVDYLASSLRGLDDEWDSFNFSSSFDGGGPLRVNLGASYAETARNTPELVAVIGNVATLVRQSNASRNLVLVYGFTEKVSGSLGVRDSALRYYSTPASANLRNSKTLSFPLDLRYKYSEKLTAGASLDFGTTDIFDAAAPSAKLGSYDRNFYGISLIYQPTDKLQGDFRAGLQRTSYNFGDSSSSPSYSLNLTHSITEKLEQSLAISQEAMTSAVGSVSETFRLGYGLQYANSATLRSSLQLNYYDANVDGVDAGFTGLTPETDVRAVSVVLGLTYTPDAHWTFGANYSFSRTIDPTSYNVNTLGLEAALRW